MIILNIGSRYIELKFSKTQETYLRMVLGRQILIFAIATGLVALVSPLYHKFNSAQHPNSKNIKCEKQ